MAESVPVAGSSHTGDRRADLPDWPAWALAMIQVTRGGTLGQGNPAPPVIYVYVIAVEDTPENRAAFDKAPSEYIINNEFREEVPLLAQFYPANLITIKVVAGESWENWSSALAIFAPAGAAGVTDTGNIPQQDSKDARQLLTDLKQAKHDAARAERLARLKAFRNIGGHEVFPHLDPKTAEVVYTDSFPNLQAR